MPSNLVKTKKQEKLWKKSKRIAHHAGLDESDDDKFWAMVNSKFQSMKAPGRRKKHA